MLPYGVLSAGLIFGKVEKRNSWRKINSLLLGDAGAPRQMWGELAVGGAKRAGGERVAARGGDSALDSRCRTRGGRNRAAGNRSALSAHVSRRRRAHLQLRCRAWLVSGAELQGHLHRHPDHQGSSQQ